MKHLYLMRHGQTRFNQLDLVQGACDSPLTDLGREQATKAKAYFESQGLSFAHTYSSTQERAADTLEIVAGSEPDRRIKGLKEWDFGAFEAQPDRLMRPLLHPERRSFGDALLPYGGESESQVGQRMLATVTDLLEQAEEGESLLAVSHGGAMWALLMTLEVDPGLPGLSNCAICHYQYENGQLDLVEIVDPLKH